MEAQTHTFSKLGGEVRQALDYTAGNEPVQIQTGQVTGGFFETLGIKAERGRMITAADDKSGAPFVVVLSQKLWRQQFKSDEQIVGKTIPLSGNVYTIIGVMPAGFASPRDNTEAWTPVHVSNPVAANFRGVHFLRTYARLADGVSLEQARAEMQRRAAFERGGNGMEVRFAGFRCSALADIGHPRRGDDVTAAFEGKAHGHPHAGTRLLLRGWNPAGAKRVEHVAQRIELVIAAPLFRQAGARGAFTRGPALDGQPQILPDPVGGVRDTIVMGKDTAYGRKARHPAEHATDRTCRGGGAHRRRQDGRSDQRVGRAHRSSSSFGVGGDLHAHHAVGIDHRLALFDLIDHFHAGQHFPDDRVLAVEE